MIPRKTGSLIAKEQSRNGNMNWKVTTEPESEPVTVDELKFFSRIDTTSEDTLLEGFIKAARIATENYLGRALITQTIKMTMDFWPSDVIEFKRPPLISVDKVVTLDEDDTETTYAATNYYTITESIPGKLALKQAATAPVNTERDYAGYLIQYKAGYGSATSVPQPIKEGIMLWAATTYASRTFDPKNPPPEARSKLDLFRTSMMVVR